MSTTIGGITLTRDMVFEDEYSYPKVAAEITPTLGGGVCVQEFAILEKGRNVTLSSTETQGLQLKSVVDSLKTLADTGAGNTYALSIISNSQSFAKTIRFRQEIDGGAIQFEPIGPRDGLHDGSIYYKGSIYMMVI